LFFADLCAKVIEIVGVFLLRKMWFVFFLLIMTFYYFIFVECVLSFSPMRNHSKRGYSFTSSKTRDQVSVTECYVTTQILYSLIILKMTHTLVICYVNCSYIVNWKFNFRVASLSFIPNSMYWNIVHCCRCSILSQNLGLTQLSE
jgi:hypothetical protein